MNFFLPNMSHFIVSYKAPIYSAIMESLSKSQVTAQKASSLVQKAIASGHDPPEIRASTRGNLMFLIKCFRNRKMHAKALAEIDRCLARGHIDRVKLLAPIADGYIISLISSSTQQEKKYRLLEAAQFICELNRKGLAGSVQARSYDTLIDKLRKLPVSSGIARLVSIAIKNKVPINTASWNERLKIAVRVSPERALLHFRFMKEAGVRPDKYSLSMMLHCLRQDDRHINNSLQLIEIAKRLNLYTEAIVTEEMALLKRNGRYEDLLTLFTQRFGPEILALFGLQTNYVTQDDPIRMPVLQVTPHALCLVIDALIRRNPDDIDRIFRDYLEFTHGKAEFAKDIYTPSIVIAALAMHGDRKYLEKARQMLLDMRTSADKPTVVTYTGYIAGLTLNGRMDLVPEVLRWMKEDGKRPNKHTWDYLMKGYQAVDDKWAMKVARRMKRKQALTRSDFVYPPVYTIRTSHT